MSFPRARIHTVLVLTALLLAGCTGSDSSVIDVGVPTGSGDDVGTQAVQGGSGASGGTVANSAPTVLGFAADRTTGDNGGSFVVTFNGTLFDRNTEGHIARVVVAAAGPVALGTTHTVTPQERNASAAPTSFGADGFKVWTGAPNDGRLEFQYRQTFPAFTPAGTYTFTATVTDALGLQATSGAIVVTLAKFSLVTVGSAPVDLHGAPLPTASWGGWSAQGGDADVPSSNYIKIINDGDQPDPRIVIDFTERGFVGAENANFTVPIDGNIQFAWFEDKTPALTAPSEGTFTFGATSGTGSVQVQFSGKGNVIYVTYRIVQMPDILPVQSYAASFTVTELA